MEVHRNVCVNFVIIWIILMNIVTIFGIEREYFIAVEEGNWNYAPMGSNQQNTDKSTVADNYIKLNNNRIGGGYKKAVFKHYTDETYTKEWPRPPNRGIAGPIIRGEVGDVLKIRFKNKASREYTIHSGGVSYLKDSEGTLYVDGTSGSLKNDDFVSPGETHTYTWLVDENSSPSPSDPACIPWIYRSFINGPRDAESGLVGVLLTCRNGTLDADYTRNDVNTEMVVLSKSFDENQSWYIEDNIKQCGGQFDCINLRAAGDADFIDSNIMRSINGIGFGNLVGNVVCAGDKVAVYFLSVGGQTDTNTMFVEGQVLDVNNERTSTVPVFPGTAVSGVMTPRNPGRYRIASMAEDNYQVGMSAYLHVKNCFHPKAKLPIAKNERTYYLGINEFDWNYGPSGVDQLTNKSLTNPSSRSYVFFDQNQLNQIGGVYKKVHYVQYTSMTYADEVPRSPEEEYLGLLGPVIRVEEGDKLKVVLRNDGKRRYSFVGQSLHHQPSDSGYAGSTTMGLINPGQRHVYNFRVPEKIVQKHDPDCVVRQYYSAGDFTRDVNSGLVGPLLICRKGTLNWQNKPVKPPSEYILLLKSFDESKSSYFPHNIQNFAKTPANVNKKDEQFKISNIRQSINGYSFGNLPVINMCKDQETVLHLMTLGKSADDVVLHFQGNTFSDANTNKDSVGLISGMTKTIKMTPNNKGIWAMISTVSEDYMTGMKARYVVTNCTIESTAPVKEQKPDRTYAIAATDVLWDYADKEADVFTGVDLNDPRADGHPYIKSDRNFIGDMYKKVIYRGFSDPGFLRPVRRGYDVRHLGLLGPIIKAEVGETIDIYFTNMVNGTRKFSLQPNGVKLDKDNEEYFYSDGQRIESRTGVAFGETKIYRWTIPASAGPGKDDPNCITWLYYSAVDRVRDPESGLIGPIQICRKGILDAHSQRVDIDREFHLLFKKFDENLSWYLDENIKNFSPGRLGTPFTSDKTFAESNNMFGINGEGFGNLKGLQMYQGEKVAWNFYSLGDEDALNTIRFHGNTFCRMRKQNGRTDSLELFPGTFETVEMTAKNAGKWLIHSDMADHMTKGMTALYDVINPNPTLPNISP